MFFKDAGLLAKFDCQGYWNYENPTSRSFPLAVAVAVGRHNGTCVQWPI